MITLYLLIAGVLIGVLFYGYTRTLRKPSRQGWQSEPSSTGMTSGPVNQIRAAGVIPKVMPVNLRTGHEDDEEHK